MAVRIGTLSARITADAREFFATMQQAERRTRQFGARPPMRGTDALGNLLGALGLGHLQAGSGMLGVITGLTRALGPYALAAWGAKKALDAFRDAVTKAHETVELAGDLGVSWRAMEQLREAAFRADDDFTQLTDSVHKLNRAVSEAATGNKEAAGAFAQLGLSVSQLEEMTVEDRLAAVSQALAGVQSQSERTRIAMELFGRSAPKLVGSLEEFARMRAAGPSAHDIAAVRATAGGEAAMQLWRTAAHAVARDARELAGLFLYAITPGAKELAEQQMRAERAMARQARHAAEVARQQRLIAERTAAREKRTEFFTDLRERIQATLMEQDEVWARWRKLRDEAVRLETARVPGAADINRIIREGDKMVAQYEEAKRIAEARQEQEAELNRLKQEAKSLMESTLTPAERLRQEEDRITQMVQMRLLTEEQAARAIAQRRRELAGTRSELPRALVRGTEEELRARLEYMSQATQGKLERAAENQVALQQEIRDATRGTWGEIRDLRVYTV